MAAPCPCGCGREPAGDVHGESGDAYATHLCAVALGDWPSCMECQDDPQDPLFAPFCSAVCDASFAARVAGVTPTAATA